ncbi:MAG: Ig-like domain-containing protein [Elusimicrobiota bacterium]
MTIKQLCCLSIALLLFSTVVHGFEVVNTMPANGSVDVPVELNIVINTDTEIDINSLLPSRVSINGKAASAYMPKLKKIPMPMRTMLLLPIKAEYDTEYEITLTDKIMDINGQVLTPYTFKFRTVKEFPLQILGIYPSDKSTLYLDEMSTDNQYLELTFNQPVWIDNDFIKVYGRRNNEVETNLDNIALTEAVESIRIDFKFPLDDNEKYSVVISSDGVWSNTKNRMKAMHKWSFNTRGKR